MKQQMTRLLRRLNLGQQANANPGIAGVSRVSAPFAMQVPRWTLTKGVPVTVGVT
ncbi:hypothetical protein [Mesorhizobium waimense]|uniref:hypothetical protein n=1 Tax=Mesorhizobium waimense TaxID=1300307 RepID=UPI00142E6C75|nr:hypothetical protein [Mesorhizobium waimense]